MRSSTTVILTRTSPLQYFQVSFQAYFQVPSQAFNRSTRCTVYDIVATQTGLLHDPVLIRVSSSAPHAMTSSVLGVKRKRTVTKHPYLSGNFAPISQTCALKPCTFSGTIPDELLGGQYVRNGGNPVSNEDLGRDAHWFDGDGMLSGVLFKRTDGPWNVEPQFVNQYVLTDVLLSTLTTPALKAPILPSIATLVNPLSSLFRICVAIFRAVFLVALSWLPGSQQVIKKISVANTAILYHDGRALATCESGPPMRVSLPSLETVGWFDGNKVAGEEGTSSSSSDEAVLGGTGLLSFLKEWTTAHPRVDPVSNEMVMFHSTFAPPYIHYSVIPATQDDAGPVMSKKLLSTPVPGVASAKMMHDFGVSSHHTVIMDLPLSLDPLQLAKNRAVIEYDSAKPSRFGIFPRHEPSGVRWFETSACCIFHTANTWDVVDGSGSLTAVDMLTCRQTSATVVFSAGNLAAPQATKLTARKVLGAVSSDVTIESYEKAPVLESPTVERHSYSWDALSSKGEEQPSKRARAGEESDASEEGDDEEEEQCRLYYYSFDMSKGRGEGRERIRHQFALSAIPFEFPSVRPDVEMRAARYIYGCTTATSSFNAALGRAVKIDGLVKIDAQTLIARGKAQRYRGVRGCVDQRSVAEIVGSRQGGRDSVQIFQAPANMYCQEPRFVASAAAAGGRDGEEDAGFLLSYVFDEAQLGADGEARAGSRSELWIIDAKGMKDVLARVVLPQRVPYGLHGGWFPEQQLAGQRPVAKVRGPPPTGVQATAGDETSGLGLLPRLSRGLVHTAIRAIGG